MYGKKRSMYGKKTMGVVRTTYLIDEEGVIEKVFGKVKAAEKSTADAGRNCKAYQENSIK